MATWPDGFQITVSTWAGLLARSAERDPGCEVVFPDARCTLAELQERATGLARHLIDFGVEPGDPVGILLPPTLDSLVGMFAVSLAGAVCVPISSRFKTTELSYAVRRADLGVVITSDQSGPWGNLAETLDSARESAPCAVLTLGRLGEPTTPRREVVRRAALVDVSDPAFILFTSGTSANPKGCVISHESISRQAQSLAEVHLQMDASDCLVSPLPLFHIAGLAIYAAALFAGAKYCHSSYMAPAAACAQLADENVTVWQPAFDTIFAPIIALPEFTEQTVGDLRIMIVAGTSGLLRRVQERLPWVSIMANYGGTEMVGSVLMTMPDDPVDYRCDSAGHVLPGVEIRLVDPDTMLPVPPGGRGEVQLRGPQIFSGYYRDDEANATAFVDGWFRTGDLATIDADGAFHFDGRLKDMMKVGGENVAAVEVEAYLIGHPAIQVVAVVARAGREVRRGAGRLSRTGAGRDAQRRRADRLLLGPDRLVQGAAARAVRR